MVISEKKHSDTLEMPIIELIEMVEKHNTLITINFKAAECYVKRYFSNGKEVALKIRQAWGWQRRQGCRGFRRWKRERWISGCWDRDR